jgi:transcription elongation factor SPT5
MMRKAVARFEANQNVGLISCFFRDSLPQRIFMEARSSKDVIDACIEVVGVYARSQEQLFLVPIDEMADLLRITKVVQEVKPGGWVRIKRGRNQGDLAQVIDTTENGEIIGVKYLPRLDLTPREEGETFDKLGRKRKKGAAPGTALNDRPPQRFFNYEEVNRSVPNKDRPIRRDGAYIFRGKTYKDGYCEEDIKLSALITEDVNPTLDEITRFTGDASAQDGGGSALASGAANATSGVDLDLLAEATRAKAEVVLRRGDHVEVLDGEQAGIEGTVDTVGAEAVTLKIELSDGETQMIEVPVRSVRKRFKPGDHIKVIAGKHLDETGLVVKVEDNVTTFLSDLSLEEVTVFSKDIHEAAEVGSGVTTVGGYNLHELVQLDAQTAGVIFKIERGVFLVLDQLGQVRSVRPAQITMKRDTGRSVALDSEAGEFRAGDTMKEVEGDVSLLLPAAADACSRFFPQERDGQVLHVYQSMLVWLFNRDLRENGGVFLSRARKLRPKAPRSAGGAPVMDLSKQNPALQAATMGLQAGGGGGALSNMKRQGGRDALAGKTVAITKGVYKTYRGIIKDTNGTMARVELHTMSKVLTIELSSLVEKE